MAAPSYTEDLTDIDLAETLTGWTQINFAGGGGGALTASPDLALQGTNCVDRQVTANDRGALFTAGTPLTGAVGGGAHVFVWMFVATPGLTDSIQNNGAYIIAGSASGNLVRYHVEGNDTYGAAGRVGKCYPIDYATRTANTSPPYRTLTGTPGATPQVFGAGINTTAAVKGANLGVDAMRYGTGAYLTAGELISAGDASDNPCTFAGFNTQNDNITNRWGILNAVGGSYELQGTFAIGQNNAGTATLCRFEDSDVTIALVDAIHAASTFTQFIIDHASTVCNWTNINITALGTTAPGQIIVNANDPTFNITGGTFSGIGTTSLQSNTTAIGTTWRAADQITLNGAQLTSCLIASSIATAAVSAATLNNMDNCEFESGGTGHAVELSSIGAGSMDWTCNTTGYDTGATGSPVTPTNTGDEDIYVNVGTGTLTINVGAGNTIPSIRSAGATVNVVAGQVTLTLTGLVVNTEVRIYTAGTTTELDGVENSGTSFAFTYTFTASTFVDIVIHNIEYDYIKLEDVLLGSSNANLPIQQSKDRWYNNP